MDILDGIAGSQREYIHWLLNASAVEGTEIDTILTEDAVDLLATKLPSVAVNVSTPSWIASTGG